MGCPKTATSSEGVSEYGLTSSSNVINRLGDESFQSATCTGTGKQSRTNKRQNTEKYKLAEHNQNARNGNAKHIQKKTRKTENKLRELDVVDFTTFGQEMDRIGKRAKTSFAFCHGTI